MIADSSLRVPRLLVLALSLAVPLPLLAQSGPVHARINLINALPERELQVFLDGEPLSEERLGPGVSTGNWPVLEGRHEIGLRWGEGEDEVLETRISADREEMTRLIIYPEYERDEESGELREVPTARSIEVRPSEEFELTLLSVSRQPVARLTVNGDPLEVPRLEPEEIEEWSGRPLLFERGEEVLGLFEFEEPGAFLCLLRDDAEGKLRLYFSRILP